MKDEKIFQKRISYTGDLNILLSRVCNDFGIGEYKSHRVITVGYEDLNIYLRTSVNTYMVKVLANHRDESDRLRYSEIIQEITKAGIVHPKLFKSSQGFLHAITLNNSTVYLFVMQYINGQSYYELGSKPSRQEIRFLSRQAAQINKIPFRPKYIYDDWAIVNFIAEYERVKQHLTQKDIDLIEPLYLEFKLINLDVLPHCFVHGDIIDTNVMKDDQGNLWIIDFSVSNFNPRIQEFAVFSCNLFDKNRPQDFEENYKIALDEYEKVLKLTEIEMKLLPTWIRVAHAMHIIGATRSKVKGEDTEENKHWLEAGRVGLSFLSKIWEG